MLRLLILLGFAQGAPSIPLGGFVFVPCLSSSLAGDHAEAVGQMWGFCEEWRAGMKKPGPWWNPAYEGCLYGGREKGNG